MEILRLNRKEFLDSLEDFSNDYIDDPFSTRFGIHIGGTEGQSSSDLWHFVRKYRLTASSLKKTLSNPNAALEKFWFGTKNLSHVPAIAWGKNHEDDGIAAYENRFGTVVRTGIFVSKRIPYLAASPDAIDLSNEVLIEVKCPFSLKNADPNLMLPDYCCRDDNGIVKLKKNHDYYYQIQTQMFTIGFKITKLLI